MYGNYAYISPAASEVEERYLGTPQTPAGELHSPAPLAVASEEREEDFGDTPNPGRRTASPCTPS